VLLWRSCFSKLKRRKGWWFIAAKVALVDGTENHLAAGVASPACGWIALLAVETVNDAVAAIVRSTAITRATFLAIGGAVHVALITLFIAVDRAVPAERAVGAVCIAAVVHARHVTTRVAQRVCASRLITGITASSIALGIPSAIRAEIAFFAAGHYTIAAKRRAVRPLGAKAR